MAKNLNFWSADCQVITRKRRLSVQKNSGQPNHND